MNLPPEIIDLDDWLQNEIMKYKYADISLNIRIHDRHISLIEKSVTEKVKPTIKNEIHNDTS